MSEGSLKAEGERFSLLAWLLQRMATQSGLANSSKLLHRTDTASETCFHYSHLCLFQVRCAGPGEVPQQLNVLAAVAEDLSSVPSTHMVTHNCL